MLTRFLRAGPRRFVGSAYDPADASRVFAVDIFIDGSFYTMLRADGCIGDGSETGEDRGGFSLSLPRDLAAHAVSIEARLANTGAPVGSPIRLDDIAAHPAAAPPEGEAKWLGGLHVAGWVPQDEKGELSLLVDGVLVDRIRPTVWRHVAIGSDHAAALAFTSHLPARFADGAAHRCAVVTAAGVELPGSPFAFVAFTDGLRAHIVGQGVSEPDLLRAALFDRLVPESVSFADYETWRAAVMTVDAATDDSRCAVILVGSGSEADTVASLEAQTHKDWIAAALPPVGPVGFSPASLRDLLHGEAAACPFFVFALAGTRLHPPALSALVAAFAPFDEAVVAYCDVEIVTGDNSRWPLAFPAFDSERLLEQGYCAHVFALRREALERALSQGGADLYWLFMAAVGPDEGSRAVVHVPGPMATLPHLDTDAASRVLASSSLAHLRQQGFEAEVAPVPSALMPAVRVRRIHDGPLVSILIPTRNRRDLLERCIGSIAPAVRRHGAEVVILDNDTTELDALRYLDDLEAQGMGRLAVPGPFNFSRMNNRGVQATRGSLLCLLNNDVEAGDPDWLDELLGRMADPGVGAAAPLLVWPSRVVQHGGIVLGSKFEAAHAFSDRLESDAGYGDLLRVARQCSAVTAACLLTRRSDYLAVGGLDENAFPINFNDVDYCLKLRALGRRVVFTPHAKLVHSESASRGSAWTADRKRLFERERRRLQLKWGPVLMDDPFYSPILALTPEPYSALAGHARVMAPRLNRSPASSSVPDGF